MTTDLVFMDATIKLIALCPTLEDLQRVGKNLKDEPMSDHDRHLLRAMWNAKKEWLTNNGQVQQ